MRRRYKTGIGCIIIAFIMLFLGYSMWSYVVEDYDYYYGEYNYNNEYYYYRPNGNFGTALMTFSSLFIFPTGAILTISGYSADNKKINKVKALVKYEKKMGNTKINISDVAVESGIKPKDVTFSLNKLITDHYFTGSFPDSAHFQLTLGKTKESASTRNPLQIKNVDSLYEDVIEKLQEFKKENFSDSTDKIESLILNGNLKKAQDLLMNKDGLILKRKIQELKEKNSSVDFDEIDLLIKINEFKKAEKSIIKIESDLNDFEINKESLRDAGSKLRQLTDRLANGELDSESYKRAADDLEEQRKDIEEKLWKLRNKLFKDEYEKPF